MIKTNMLTMRSTGVMVAMQGVEMRDGVGVKEGMTMLRTLK